MQAEQDVDIQAIRDRHQSILNKNPVYRLVTTMQGVITLFVMPVAAIWQTIDLLRKHDIAWQIFAPVALGLVTHTIYLLWKTDTKRTGRTDSEPTVEKVDSLTESAFDSLLSLVVGFDAADHLIEERDAIESCKGRAAAWEWFLCQVAMSIFRLAVRQIWRALPRRRALK